MEPAHRHLSDRRLQGGAAGFAVVRQHGWVFLGLTVGTGVSPSFTYSPSAQAAPTYRPGPVVLARIGAE